MTPQQRWNASPRGQQKIAEAKARYRQSAKGQAAERAYKERYRERERELVKLRAQTPEFKAKQAARQKARRAALIPRMHPNHREAVAAVYERAREQGMTVDHIIPLYGEMVWGLHAPQNLQLLTRSENSRKLNSVPG
jgi:5-methylcytosine-specific restriction endonuclease McrA